MEDSRVQKPRKRRCYITRGMAEIILRAKKYFKQENAKKD